MAAIWPWHATPPKTGDTVAKAIATVRNCCQRFELETLWVWGLGVCVCVWVGLESKRARIAVCTTLIIACCCCCCSCTHLYMRHQGPPTLGWRAVKCKIPNKWPRCCCCCCCCHLSASTMCVMA